MLKLECVAVFPLLHTVTCWTPFFYLPAAILFTDMIHSHHVHNGKHTPASSQPNRHTRDCLSITTRPVCPSRRTNQANCTQTHAHTLSFCSNKYLGKSSSCHSSLTSMLSMRKVASAVPILCQGGRASAHCGQQTDAKNHKNWEATC